MEKQEYDNMDAPKLDRDMIMSGLGSDYAGVAKNLELLRQQTHAETVNGLVNQIRSRMNPYGNLQFETGSAGAAFLGIDLKSPGPLHLVVDGSLIEEAIRRLQNRESEIRTAMFKILSNEKEQNEEDADEDDTDDDSDSIRKNKAA